MNNNKYKVGSYIRLSKEDSSIDKKNSHESESIINQRNLISKFLIDNNFCLYDEYVDDGYSGTNFERPEFQRLLNDIELKKINMVITKDLSRLGRDYIQSGYYIEQYFPSKNVRYISILDNIDTAFDSTNNDIAPFKVLFNDMQSKDTSRKIRSILKIKKQQGLFLGSRACYGYKKDKNNKYKLVIDRKQASVVKEIFMLKLDGKSIFKISEILNKKNIKTPSFYRKNNYKKTLKWTKSSVNNILKNPIYTGDMVQGKQRKLNYKSKKRIINSSENWIVVPNTHEAIIDKNIFYKINSK